MKKKYNQQEYMNDQQKKELHDEKHKNNPNKEEFNGKRKGKNKKKDKEVKTLDFSKCDYPIPYSHPRLIENWYDFNDSGVTPIQGGTIQSKFGGAHDGNAYMLVYR